MRGETARKRIGKTLPLMTRIKRIFTDQKMSWQETAGLIQPSYSPGMVNRVGIN